MKSNPGPDYVITAHARFEMERRGIDEATIAKVIGAPEQRYNVRPGREVLQSRVRDERTAREYLIRVFLDVDPDPVEVVTVYRTGKIGKYWRT